jgi:serine/threonine protein kinase
LGTKATQGCRKVWVSDFGICLIADRPTRHTETGEVVGPVVFMAPELEGGGQLDVTVDADIYSLGKVIYYMLTGGVRLPRENLEELFARAHPHDTERRDVGRQPDRESRKDDVENDGKGEL